MTDTSSFVRYRPVKDEEETTVPRRAMFLLFEEFLPWREPKTYKGQENARAFYSFSKTDKHVLCESRLEERVLHGLDFDRDVAAVVSQPFELSNFADGKRRRHVPDFFVRCVRGPDRVVDVKPAHKVDEAHNARSFQAMGETCAEAGWEYVVATEPDPVFHANIS